MAGTPEAAVIDELTPQQGGLIVAKRSYSAFTQTDLDATCRVHHIDRLVCRQHTDCCCRHTSHDAFTRGIKVVAVADATAVYQPFAVGRYQQAQDDALLYLRTYYGAEITDAAALIHRQKARRNYPAAGRGLVGGYDGKRGMTDRCLLHRPFQRPVSVMRTIDAGNDFSHCLLLPVWAAPAGNREILLF